MWDNELKIAREAAVKAGAALAAGPKKRMTSALRVSTGKGRNSQLSTAKATAV